MDMWFPRETLDPTLAASSIDPQRGMHMYAITGATGQLGRLVIDTLLATVPADHIVAAVRSPAKAHDLAERGVVVREADYTRPETLATALVGVDKLLLISSTEVAGPPSSFATAGTPRTI
jgi:NAD(P)H dehydrogenase (quinone)